MAKVKLTAGRIEAFTCPADKPQAFLWDADVNGLAVRATAGAKAYIYQGRLKGKSLRVTIGDVRIWSLEEYRHPRSEEHTSELQSLMRISYAVFCLKKKNLMTEHKTNKNM